MTRGIHHITAIASDAATCVHFFTRILGLRLVKKTVNQDDTGTYHLFFGDRIGHPGMDLTFFIFLPSVQGNAGNGLVSTISFAVLPDALEFWKNRFDAHGVMHSPISTRFGKRRLPFEDADGIKFELVGISQEESDDGDVWATSDISKDNAIRHFYSATLSVADIKMIEPFLIGVLGYTQIKQEGAIFEYEIRSSKRASRLEVKEHNHDSFGRMGAGTVHHIAFRAKDEGDQMAMRKKIIALGLSPTEVINRFYFQSVYVRSPAGILCEIATDGPGFTADETEEALGHRLALPPFLEPHRSLIEAQLPPIGDKQ